MVSFMQVLEKEPNFAICEVEMIWLEESKKSSSVLEEIIFQTKHISGMRFSHPLFYTEK